jgi:cyanophycin synthetase
MTQAVFPVAGFYGRLGQPEQILCLRLTTCPESIDWPALDNWLHEKFQLVQQSPALKEENVVAHSLADTMGKLCWRIMLLAAFLQRAASIPVFEPGKLLSWQADETRPGSWFASISVVQIDHVPKSMTRLVYEGATLLIMGVATGPNQFANVEALYQQLDFKVLQPLRSVMTVGKSTLPLLACAYERGIPWRHLGAGMFQLGWGSESLRMHNSKVGSDSALGVAVAQNKWVAAEWMRRAGLPVPQHRLAVNEKEARAVQAVLGWPLVVKPADRDRGEGVSVDITNESQLVVAFQQAAALSSLILVERQVVGVCHRLLVVRGQLIYAVKRLPVAVCGDGKHRVDELITATNMTQMDIPSWARAPLYPIDDLTKACLHRADQDVASVPAAGVWVKLRPFESTQWGGLDEDVSTTLHPDNAAIACRAAALFGLDMAGIDIISPDISRPWHENGAVINEVNAAPVLGQGDSSRRTLPRVLNCLLPCRGRICIEAYVGAEKAMTMAQNRQQILQSQGVACYVTSHTTTLDPSGALMVIAHDGLFARCLSLLEDKAVQFLVIVIQTDELLHLGLPVDILTRVVTSGEPLALYDDVEKAAPAVNADQMMVFLKRFSSIHMQDFS